MPFIIADLAIIGSDDSTCLIYGYGESHNIMSFFYLGGWLVDDAYIKLAVLAIGIILARTRRQNLDK